MLVFKSMDNAALEILSQAFNSILVEGLPIPSAWKEGLLIPLPKISQPKSLPDFRPIVVLPIIYRIFSSYVNYHLMEKVEKDKIIHPTQRGFRRSASTTDQLVIVKSIVTEYRKKRSPLFMSTLDIKNAYGSVVHSKLREILNHVGLNLSTSQLIMDMITDHKIKILANNSTSPAFEATFGVPQGDPLSPLVFNIYFNAVTSIVDSFKGVSINGDKIVMLLYADDIIVLSESAKEMTLILSKLKDIALQLGLHFATHKCKAFGVTAAGNKSTAKVYLNEANINNPTDDLEYLGARLLRNLTWSPTSNKLLDKINLRLANFTPRHLRLNTVRTVLLSKVLSVPRYLSSVDAIPQSTIESLETKISGSVKKKMGCDNRLSKAIIYGDKQLGGLGLMSPVDIACIERMAAVCRFVNSTSPLTQNIARSNIKNALKKSATDSLWKKSTETMKELNLYFKSTESGWVLSNRQTHKPIQDIRQLILDNERTKKIIDKQGQLNSELNWHSSVLSMWRNHTLSYYQQRLLFYNLHHSIYLGNETSKCDTCHTIEDWTHTFQSCPKCVPEKHELYATWDDISLKYSLNKIRFAPDSNIPNCLPIEFDGRCTKDNWSNKKRLPKAVALDIYKALAIYIENCYKNSNWYNRPNSSFIKNTKYLSAFQRQQ